MPSKNGKVKSNGHHKELDLTDLGAQDLVPVHRFRKGMRVRWGNQCGIVRSSRRGKVEVYWGTTDRREVVTTVPATELEPM